jgi:hypothetical protein
MTVTFPFLDGVSLSFLFVYLRAERSRWSSKSVCEAFRLYRDRAQSKREQHESIKFSSSLLFVFADGFAQSENILALRRVLLWQVVNP